MIEKTENIIKKTASIFNLVAGGAIVAAMLVVVANVILRKIFKHPILGSSEYVGFISVLIISFGLAYCLVVNAHIAVDFIVEKFKPRTQGIIDTITGILVFIFMSFFTWKVFDHATNIFKSGQLSPTTQFPFYIFIYLMAVCFFVFCLVYLIRIKDSIGKARLK
ncbi:MAG: TRAP transporter small permease [Clostridiales bacterium]|nr:TRAP transporter small permease [Clostridiales bacterium]